MNREELREKYPHAEFGEINVRVDFEQPLTGEKNQWGDPIRDWSETAHVIPKGWEFYLNHSCDEWVIGSLEEAQSFLGDMVKAIEYAESHPII